MAEINLSFAEKVFVARKRLQETQDQFATRFGVRPLTVKKWESGDSEPHGGSRSALDDLFRSVLLGDKPRLEMVSYQLELPFNDSVNIGFQVSPLTAQSVRLGIQITKTVA
jgi:transcriptional regulator with XRE-family HTH domain